MFGGQPREILRLCSTGKVTNFTSPSLLDEFEAVLQRPKFDLDEEYVYGIIRLFRDTFSIVRPKIHLSIITAYPADNRILETAIIPATKSKTNPAPLDAKSMRKILAARM